LASHSIANTISIDDKVFRVVFVLVSETTKSSLDSILELRRNNLLTLLLDDLLRVVLTTLLINSGAEADNALRSRVTNVNANQHGAREKFTAELQVE
jgi:hypothetical protein